jgi:hypothetical protein
MSLKTPFALAEHLRVMEVHEMGPAPLSAHQAQAFIILFIFAVLWIKLRASHMLGKCPAPALYPQY